MNFTKNFCDSYRIQTCNLLIRSQMLYSVELRSHALVALRLQRYNVFLYYAIFFLIFLRHTFFLFPTSLLMP